MSLDRAAIEPAYRRIAPHIRRTPVLQWSHDPHDIRLKLEFTQHAGSFKTRGAFANLLLRDIPAAGVAAASGGNHGAAVAYAAQKLGIAAKIFVRGISSPAKIARIRACGADLTIAGQTYGDALAACQAHIAQTGALSEIGRAHV